MPSTADKPPGDSTEIVVMAPEKVGELVEDAVARALGRAQAAPLLVDKETMARQLACTPRHLDNLRKLGLPFVKIGDATRFDPRAVLEWIQRQQGGA